MFGLVVLRVRFRQQPSDADQNELLVNPVGGTFLVTFLDQDRPYDMIKPDIIYGWETEPLMCLD